MKNLLMPLLILCMLTANKISYAQHPLDFDVTVDSSCGGYTINIFKVKLKDSVTNINDVQIRWEGDSGYLDVQGNYTNTIIRDFRWIFNTNNGIGNFDVKVTLSDNNGSSIYKYITVINGKPEINIYSNSTNLTKNDTLFFNSKFLSRPFFDVTWFELTDSGSLINFNNSTEYLSLSNLDNRPYKIIAFVEDMKGCNPADTISINILPTGISSSKYNDVLVKHHYENKSVSIENLSENTLQVFDISGRQVAQYYKQSNENYTIKDLPSGIYIARANNYRTKIFIP